MPQLKERQPGQKPVQSNTNTMAGPRNKKSSTREKLTDTLSGAVRQVAAIDIGTSAIRLALAEIDPHGQIRRLETLNQSVSLGRDTFTEGRISYETIEECVRTLSSFKQVMQEYLVSQPEQIRAVATSAVREAANKDAFINRVFIATGISVEAIDEAEITRLTYLGVWPYLRSDSQLAVGNNLVVEVGGGSTEFLHVTNGNIAYSYVSPLGSLRSMERGNNKDTGRSDLKHQAEVLVDEVLEQLQGRENIHLIMLGGEARFAARQVNPDWDPSKPAKIHSTKFFALCDAIQSMSVDDLVETYHITYPEAETLAPALLMYATIAKKLRVRKLLVSGITMRDGLLMEMVQRDAYSREFNRQIIRSARELAIRYDVNLSHADEVTTLAGQLFDALADVHNLGSRHRLILKIAALLHEIGQFVSERSYHKHSMYLIQNSEIFGLGQQMQTLTAEVARYHHRAKPSRAHSGYASLNRIDRLAVSQLAAILRVADALGQSRRQRISKIHCQVSEALFVVLVPGVEDLTLEQVALQDKGSLFQDVFGMEVKFRRKTTTA